MSPIDFWQNSDPIFGCGSFLFDKLVISEGKQKDKDAVLYICGLVISYEATQSCLGIYHTGRHTHIQAATYKIDYIARYHW